MTKSGNQVPSSERLSDPCNRGGVGLSSSSCDCSSKTSPVRSNEYTLAHDHFILRNLLHLTAIMAPAVVIDNTPDFSMDDFNPPPAKNASTSTPRTLLLAPPSVASHPESLSKVAEAYDRNATDIQMLDRLALGLVSLPEATYDVVLVLSDVSQGQQTPERTALKRDVMERIAQSLKPGGRLKSQSGEGLEAAEQTEAILAGLVQGGEDEGMVKPAAAASQTVKLSFGRKKKTADAAAVPANNIEAANTAKRKSADISTSLNGNGAAPAPAVKTTPIGVGFIENTDDLDLEEDDFDFPTDEQLQNAERIDPDTLLTEEDRLKPLNIREFDFVL